MCLVVLLGYLKRAALVCMVPALGLLAPLAQGQGQVQAQAQPSRPALEVISTTALLAPHHATLQDVQAQVSSQWQNFEPSKTYSTNQSTALWVRLQLTVSAPPNGWSIKIPKPYLDRIELYLPATSSGWTVQAAGDQVAHTSWPVQALHPQFLLPALPVGDHTVFVKFINSVPFNTELQLLDAQDSVADNLEHSMLSFGIVVLVLCMAFISACIACVYRDTAYAWYSLYALSAALTASAYTGLANYLIWPDTTFWPERSIHVTLLLSILLQVLFCYVAYEPHKLWPRFTALTWIGGFSILAGVVVLSGDHHIWIYTAGLVVPMILNLFIVISMVAVRLRLGELSAKLWMLAYVPLAVLISAATLEGFGMLKEAFMGFYWPLYALAFEVPVLLLALMLRAKSRDAHAVTLHTRQQLDPLTGFILPRAYEGIAAPLWEKSAVSNLDLAVAYIQITQPGLSFLGGQSQTPSDERIVRVLRTVFRQEDTFAQVSDHVYAVLMPRKALGEGLQTRLSRVVVQLHMLSLEIKTDHPLRTRIAACTNRSLPLQWPDVHKILLGKFDEEKTWAKRSIHVVSKRSNQQLVNFNLSSFWAQAFDAELQSDGLSK
jgi:two-component system, sensor histidine kinase LadS